MSDIVHWLRKLAALVEADHAPQHVVMHMRAAADEITRLRAENERLTDTNAKIYAELWRLRDKYDLPLSTALQMQASEDAARETGHE